MIGPPYLRGMIQRVQSVFLLVSAVLLGLFIVPSLRGISWSEGILEGVHVLLAGLAAALNLVTIFLYRRRPRQMAWCITTAFVIVLAAVPHVYRAPGEAVGQWWTYLLPLAFICTLLARTFIKRDDDLVRSMDRLR